MNEIPSEQQEDTNNLPFADPPEDDESEDDESEDGKYFRRFSKILPLKPN